MDGGITQIQLCPPNRIAEALSLVLGELPPSQRREIATVLLQVDDPPELANEALYIVQRDGRIYAAAWGQRQSGNIAVFWPPRFAGPADPIIANRLAEQVVQKLDETAIEMTQLLIAPGDEDIAAVVRIVHFRQLAQLRYLTCETARFPLERPKSELEFVTYNGTMRGRLKRLIERSYEQTLDCTDLNDVRDVDNVITGYQATGVYQPGNWHIARAGGDDVGILLLADHPNAKHWELMYMGLVPEVRGRGWGRQIAQHAQWLAGRAGVERIVLAVDSANEPAVKMYQSTGFEMWDARDVYVRFPPQRSR